MGFSLCSRSHNFVSNCRKFMIVLLSLRALFQLGFLGNCLLCSLCLLYSLCSLCSRFKNVYGLRLFHFDHKKYVIQRVSRVLFTNKHGSLRSHQVTISEARFASKRRNFFFLLTQNLRGKKIREPILVKYFLKEVHFLSFLALFWKNLEKPLKSDGKMDLNMIRR